MKKIQTVGVIFRWNQTLHERIKDKRKQEIMVLESVRKGRLYIVQFQAKASTTPNAWTKRIWNAHDQDCKRPLKGYKYPKLIKQDLEIK